MSRLRIPYRAMLGGVVLAVLANLLVGAPGHADRTGPPVIQGPPSSALDTRKLVNLGSGLCAAPAGGNASPNNATVQYFCDTDPTRLWFTTLRDDGAAELQNAGTDECLSPAGGSLAVGAPIVQYTCDADPARGWAFARFGDDAGFQLMNEHSGLCVSIGAGGLNAMLVQTTCDESDLAARWYFSDADQIRNVNSQMCMYSEPAGLNMPVKQTYCGGPYRITFDSTGYAIVEDTQDSLCLSPAGGSTAKNAAIVEYSCDGDPARHWIVTRSAGGIYSFQNVHSGMCLSPAGGSTAAAAPIVQYSCDGDRSRLWLVETL